MREIIVIAHNVRSTHNVGSLLRTAEGLGVTKVYLTGYTPYPAIKKDDRLPHLAAKLSRQIAKTSLGAEKLVPWKHRDNIFELVDELETKGWQVCALEQTAQAVSLADFKAPAKVAIVLGREVEGIEAEVLGRLGRHIYIPMHGKKESFNVVQAAAMCLYALRFD